MSNQCSICRHPNIEAINASLASGEGVRALAERMGLGRSSVSRHKIKCLDNKAPQTMIVVPDVTPSPERAPTFRGVPGPGYPCLMCTHEDRAKVDQMLISGVPQHQIAKQLWGNSELYHKVRLHARNCIPRQIKLANAESNTAYVRPMLDTLNELRELADKQLQKLRVDLDKLDQMEQEVEDFKRDNPEKAIEWLTYFNTFQRHKKDVLRITNKTMASLVRVLELSGRRSGEITNKMPARKTTDASEKVKIARAKKLIERAKEQIESGQLYTLRSFLESPDYFPAKRDLAPAMWAIVDALDGRAQAVPPDLCETLFNCQLEALPTDRPRVFGFGAGRRAGKSWAVLAPRAVHLAWTLPLPNLDPGETARVAVVAMDKDAAQQVLDYVKSIIATSPVLSASLVGDVIQEDGDSQDIGTKTGVALKRPDGKRVEVVVRAASRGGSTLRSRTLIALIMDEACFFRSDDGSKVNDEEIFAAAMGSIRFTPGAQILIASSPWVEGEGLLERLISENWTNGTQGTTALVAARVSSRVMRPDFDPDGSEEAKECATEDGLLKWKREIDAIPLPKGSMGFFTQAMLDMACALTIDTDDVQFTGAGADYAHSSDRSALAVVRRYAGGIFAPTHVEEKQSGHDVKPTEVYKSFALKAKSLGAHVVASDVHCKENVREVYERHGMTYKLSPSTEDVFEAGRTVFREGRVSLYMISEKDRDLVCKQLAQVMLVPGQQGKMKIHLPRTSVKDVGNGKGTTHCDLAVALMNALCEAGANHPELWTHDAERRAQRQVEDQQQQRWTPRPGSRESLALMRNPGWVKPTRWLNHI